MLVYEIKSKNRDNHEENRFLDLVNTRAIQENNQRKKSRRVTMTVSCLSSPSAFAQSRSQSVNPPFGGTMRLCQFQRTSRFSVLSVLRHDAFSLQAGPYDRLLPSSRL